MIGVVFFDSDRDGVFGSMDDIRVTTNRSGEFGRGVQGRLVPAPAEAPAEPLYRFNFSGFDSSTGYFYSGTAPAGATVFSPLTVLAGSVGSAADVRQSLGLATGGAALNPATDFLTFDHVRQLASSNAAAAQDAARLQSINLQLMNVAVYSSDFGGDPFDAGRSLQEGMDRFAQVIRTTGNGRLSDKDTILRLLPLAPFGAAMSPEQRDVAAELIADYGAAVPERIASRETAAAWQRLFRFYILPEILRLNRLFTPAEVQRVRNITPADIAARLPFFSGLPIPNVAGNLVGVPDYREISRPVTLGACEGPPPSMPYCNDLLFDPLPGLIRREPFDYRILSVQSGEPGRLTATLMADGAVRLEPVGGYTGYTFFDYRVASRSGAESESRVYVYVNPGP